MLPAPYPAIFREAGQLLGVTQTEPVRAEGWGCFTLCFVPNLFALASNKRTLFIIFPLAACPRAPQQ